MKKNHLLPALAAWLFAAPAIHAAATLAPNSGGALSGFVISGVAGLIRALPVESWDSVGKFLGLESAQPEQFSGSLEAMQQRAEAFTPNGRPALARNMDDRELVEFVSPDFVEQLGVLDEAPTDGNASRQIQHIAAKLRILEHTWADIPNDPANPGTPTSQWKPGVALKDRAPLIKALRAVNGRLQDDQLEQLQYVTDGVLAGWLDHRAGRPAPAQPAAATGAAAKAPKEKALPPAGSQVVRVQDLLAGGVGGAAEFRRIGDQVVRLNNEAFHESRKNRLTGIFPMDREWFDAIIKADKYGFSQVYLDDQGNVMSFLLAYYDHGTGSVYVIKMGTMRENRSMGLAKDLFYRVALKAAQLGVRRVTLNYSKRNVEAGPAYARLGFVTDPAKLREAAESTVFYVTVDTDELIRRSAPVWASVALPAPIGSVEWTTADAGLVAPVNQLVYDATHRPSPHTVHPSEHGRGYVGQLSDLIMPVGPR